MTPRIRVLLTKEKEKSLEGEQQGIAGERRGRIRMVGSRTKPWDRNQDEQKEETEDKSDRASRLELAERNIVRSSAYERPRREGKRERKSLWNLDRMQLNSKGLSTPP